MRERCSIEFYAHTHIYIYTQLMDGQIKREREV